MQPLLHKAMSTPRLISFVCAQLIGGLDCITLMVLLAHRQEPVAPAIATGSLELRCVAWPSSLDKPEEATKLTATDTIEAV